MIHQILSNFNIALEAVFANRLRSLLTALGIIFGVAAVIAMLAIGTGAQNEILEQIKIVGVNNIMIEPVVEQEEEELAEEVSTLEVTKYSPGLTLEDARSILNIVPEVERVSPEIILDTYIVKSGVRRSAKVIGVTNDYFDIASFELNSGKYFSEIQLEKGLPVCIIGMGVQAKFFPTENPIGKILKCGSQWLRVVGVLQERIISKKSRENLGLRDFNMDVYIPLKTMLLRFKNRSLVTKANIQAEAEEQEGENGNTIQENKKPTNYHQLDRIVVQVTNSEILNASADVISRMLERRHYNVVDYHISIPELLLKQEKRTKNIFNIVLGAIAGISLIVGGIGIMNIMLASVMERIKEIGLRLSIGAKKKDIIQQFLFEAMLISVTGGIVGIILGMVMAFMISKIADIPTIITVFSILVSFGVAASIGLVFGIAPAQKAASQDPIASLRYE